MATTTRHHIEWTFIDKNKNKFILYPKNTVNDVYTADTGGVTINGKIVFFGTCSTAAATAAKVVSVSGFALVAGAHLTVKFTNGITVASPTLNVNSAGAKPIKYKGNNLLANAIAANSIVSMVYDGANFNVVGGQDGGYLTKKTDTKFFIIGTPTDANGSPNTLHYDNGVYVDTVAGQLVATKFKGNGSQLTALNASNISSGTLSAARLATSGVTAGTYGQVANASLAAGGSFKVSQVVVDRYGRVTSAATRTITLPADNNTDTNVTTTVNTTTKYYLAGTTSATTSTGTLIYDTGIYTDATAGKLYATSMQATTFYLGSTAKYINATKYTGQSATVASISSLLVDSVASANANGVTTKGLSANQGYLLQNQINTINSNLSQYMTGVRVNVSWNSYGNRLDIKEAFAQGGRVYIMGLGTIGYISNGSWMTLGTIPYPYRPKRLKVSVVFFSDFSSYAQMNIDTDGVIKFITLAYVGSANLCFQADYEY